MSDEHRSIELEFEVVGTPDEVWRAIATGPGISSWYVPHIVEEREGGSATASFGAGPEMQIAGRVVAWEPPQRIVFDGGEGVPGLAFEWMVEARRGGTCIVRLVNTGFGSGADWDAQYDGLAEGWPLFLFNLQLHLQHFGGQSASSMLPMAMWTGPRDEVWPRIMGLLGLPLEPDIGEHIAVVVPDSPPMSGTVVDAAARRIALLLDQPAPGTAIIAAEGTGDHTGVSIWSYLYGDAAATIVERDLPRWQAWLDRHATGRDGNMGG